MPAIGVSSRLISVPALNSAVWTQRTADITNYIGLKARLLVLYQSGASFTGDVQLDDFNIGGNSFDPETGTNGFQVPTVIDNSKIAFGNLDNIQSDYDAITWTGIGSNTSAGGFFIRDPSGTPSGSTGLDSGNTGSYYFYAETSGSGSSNDIWLLSPEVTIKNDELSFYTAQYGATSGPIYAYLVVTSGEVEYSATSLDHMDRWGALDTWNYGTLDSITQFDVWQGEVAVNVAVTTASSLNSVVDVSGSASIAATSNQPSITIISTVSATASTSLSASSENGVIRFVSAAVTGAASVASVCRVTAGFGGTVLLSASATSACEKISTVSASVPTIVSATANGSSVLTESALANIEMSGTSYPSVTFAVSCSGLISFTPTSIIKVLGEDWSLVPVGSEIWSDVTIGNEVWTQQQISSNGSWAAQ
jgi:hypothetical protein